MKYQVLSDDLSSRKEFEELLCQLVSAADKTTVCMCTLGVMQMGQLPSQLGTTQISVKSTGFYPYFGRKINGNRSQSGDTMLQVLQRNLCCTQLCWQLIIIQIDWPMLACTFLHLVSLLFIVVIDPYSLFKFLIILVRLLFMVQLSV